MIHVVRDGESLASIASRYGRSPYAFLAANTHRLYDGPGEVAPGEALHVPGDHHEQLAGFLGDFASDAAADPGGFGAAWNTIQTQLQSEGAGSTDILAAQHALSDAFDQFAAQGFKGSEALDAAKQFVLTGQTVAGAVGMVEGLIGAAQSGAPPATLLTGFTGTMIGVLATAGVVSAGVGAAIVAGVSFVVSLLQAAGLFGSAPSGETICGNITITSGPLPSYLFPGPVNPAPWATGKPNCIGVWDPYWNATKNTGIAPGSALWRHFPIPPTVANIFTSPDAPWFGATYSWLGGASLAWQPKNNAQPVSYSFGSGEVLARNSNAPGRPIDAAFPLYHQTECETAAGGAALLAGGVPTTVLPQLAQFQQAFFAALKLNWEYPLNGLQPTSDDRVLAHTIQVWNRTHEAGAGFDLRASTAQPWFPDGTTCQGIPPLYMAILTNEIIAQPVTDIMSSDGLGVHINTGAKKTATMVVGAGATSSSSSATTAIVGVGLLGALLTAAWFALGKPMTVDALKAAWRHA